MRRTVFREYGMDEELAEKEKCFREYAMDEELAWSHKGYSTFSELQSFVQALTQAKQSLTWKPQVWNSRVKRWKESMLYRVWSG